MTVETIAPGIQYSDKTLHRARRALRCSRLHLHFFQTLQCQSIPLTALAAPAGVTQGYTRRPLTELGAEQDLLWLIQVGVLRREVDGQGITDSFRLTPLGQSLVNDWAGAGAGGNWQPPSIASRLYNGVQRWASLLL
ncbi:MAG: hypothetical protein VKJ85_09425 [Prochlorothrix sp.]|nr:hypothetical protein [Prochlorothrix sp.]